MTMKKYRVVFWDKGKLKPSFLAEISHKNRWVGEYICFYSDGRKQNQHKFKNDKPNGIHKNWNRNTNDFFQNWKKFKRHGIKIYFA